jgi:hypothetical protein
MTPFPAGTFVNPEFNFAQKWTQPDTSDRCHENAFLMYDKIRRKEDLFINGARKEDGLAVRTVSGKVESPQSVDAFRYQAYTVSKATSQSVNGSNSIEWSGFFVPDANAIYAFSLTSGANGRIWVGDVACYDFLVTNQTTNGIDMKKDKYYAVRFQYLNNLSQGNVNIVVKKNGVAMTNPLPNFRTIRNSDGTQFFRKLMYYGLVGSSIPGGVFYFRHNNQSNYKEIQDAKFKNVVVYERVISSGTFDKTYVATESQALSIQLTTPYSIGTITSATYGFSNKQANLNKVINGLNTNATNNGGSISIQSGGYNALFGDPSRGNMKTLTVKLRIALKKDAKKDGRIYLNNNCQVVVDYNNPTSTKQNPDLILPIYSGGNCLTNSTIQIYDNGNVVAGSGWIYPTQTEVNSSVANLDWAIPQPTLSKNMPLDTLTSNNRKYRLQFLKTTGKLLYKHCRNPTNGSGKSTYTNIYNVITSSEYTKPPIAYYLYRPNYSELGGNIYMSEKIGTETSLTLIPKNSKNLLSNNGYSNTYGSPLMDGPYTKLTNTLNVTNCKSQCDSSLDCGNYAYNSSTKDCFIDKSANNRPIYTSKLYDGKQDNVSSIYRKKYKMANDKTLSQVNSGEYSEFSIKPDALIIATVPTNTVNSANTLSSTTLANSALAANVINTGNIVNERFTGGSTIEGFRDIPERYLTKLPAAPDTSTEEGRINDLQSIMYQQNVLYSLSSIAAISFFVGTIVLIRK